MIAVPMQDRIRPGATWPDANELHSVARSLDRAFTDVERLKIRLHGLLDTGCSPSIREGAHPGTEFVAYLSLLNESLALDTGELKQACAWLAEARDALAVEMDSPGESVGRV